MASTLPTVDWQKDGSIPPRSNDNVAQIMQEEGISRRAAYRLLQKRHAEAVDVTGVTEGQRVAVMSALINIPEARQNVHSLLAELHEIGVKIDGHDVTKTLFALQKQGFVRFRERNHPRTLYAIVVTDAGFTAWNHRDGHELIVPMVPMLEEAETVPFDELPTDMAIKEASREVAQFVVPISRVFEEARGRAERAAAHAEEAENTIRRPWPKGELGNQTPLWSQFFDLRNRALRAKKLNAAAKLLEEVGGHEVGGHDDAVLTIMVETQFTDLENEVLNLLTLFGEIE